MDDAPDEPHKLDEVVNETRTVDATSFPELCAGSSDGIQLPMAEISSDQAVRLGDLYLVSMDLESVVEICHRLLLAKSADNHDEVLIEALWTAALVKYVRCFTSGKRLGISEDIIKHLPGDPIDAHRFFKNIRDKHVAHSVNPFEEVRVDVILSDPRKQPQTVEGIATFARRLISSDEEGVRTLAGLAAAARQHVIATVLQLQNDLIEWAKAQPITTFIPRPAVIYTPGPEDASKPR